MVIFRGFRRLVEAIHALTIAVADLVAIQQQLGPAYARLEKLELSRHQFEAECEGMLLKADGKLKAANSAEQRERQLKKANDRLADPFDPEGVESADNSGPLVPTDDAPPSEAPGVPPLRLALATNDKAHAVKAKWGI